MTASADELLEKSEIRGGQFELRPEVEKLAVGAKTSM
jgi:hypothetical protein